MTFPLYKEEPQGRAFLSNINWKCTSQICQWIFKRSQINNNWHNQELVLTGKAGSFSLSAFYQKVVEEIN